MGWAGLGWAGLGWAGLGWAGLGWAGLGWALRFRACTPETTQNRQVGEAWSLRAACSLVPAGPGAGWAGWAGWHTNKVQDNVGWAGCGLGGTLIRCRIMSAGLRAGVGGTLIKCRIMLAGPGAGWVAH